MKVSAGGGYSAVAERRAYENIPGVCFGNPARANQRKCVGGTDSVNTGVSALYPGGDHVGTILQENVLQRQRGCHTLDNGPLCERKTAALDGVLRHVLTARWGIVDTLQESAHWPVAPR